MSRGSSLLTDGTRPDLRRDATPDTKIICAIGLMSGTSLDGVDAALLTTDGERELIPGPFLTLPYTQAFRSQLISVLGRTPREDRTQVRPIEAELTRIHAQAVDMVLKRARKQQDAPPQIPAPTLIGFHGHTLTHAPERGWTWQIGNGGDLARRTGLDVVYDFRSADMAAGGQGAPLACLFHRALCADLKKPVAVLNIGGVANITWIGPDDDLVAFDTGPGNAPIDDWVRAHGLGNCDHEGALAAQGEVNQVALDKMMAHSYFRRTPPKSLDRGAISCGEVAALSVADGAATLSALVARCVAQSLTHVPAPPRRWIVTGGGRLNPVLMTHLRTALEAPVDPVESLDGDWSGDALEAQAFAYLAVRACKGLPLSIPTTTGVVCPFSGGRLRCAPNSQAQNSQAPTDRPSGRC